MNRMMRKGTVETRQYRKKYASAGEFAAFRCKYSNQFLPLIITSFLSDIISNNYLFFWHYSLAIELR